MSGRSEHPDAYSDELATEFAAPRHRRPGWTSRLLPGAPRWLRIALALIVVVAAPAALAVRAALPAGADNITVSQDNLRTGWDKSEPALSPSNIVASDFGQLFSTSLNGQVYAQPLVIGNTVVVGTENDFLYGLDAVTGAIKWSRNVGPAWPSATVNCADLTPTLGNTSTGVYDPTSNTVYMTTKVNDGADVTHPNWYLHAFDPGTGAEKSGWPTKIVGTPANAPNHPFVAEAVNQRPGLLLLDGSVYLGFGGQCDHLASLYVGFIVGVNTSNRAITMWADEAGASSSMAGIWMGGGGLVSDGSGRIFFSTGNGVTPPNSPGTSPPQTLSESVVRLGVGQGGALSAKDFFSPSDAATLDKNDQDLGSGGPVALPSPYFGTSAIPNLMVEVGKDGRVFLLNRDNLGGKAQGPGGTDNVIGTLGPYKGLWGHPAAYGGEGGYVYYTQNSDTMLAFKYGTDGSGKPSLSFAGNTGETFGYTSGTPIVTSDGTTAGSGVVWVEKAANVTGAGAQLCAYAAVPVNDHMDLLRCFAIGTSSKFAMPSSSNGRVYVGTRDGKLIGFGRPAGSALTAAQTAFGDVSVGQSKTVNVVATATKSVTVTGVSAAAPFSAAAPSGGLPVTLSAGQTISVPVTYTPTSPGSVIGVLSLAVTTGSSTGTVTAGLQGNGIKPGFTPTPSTVDFGEIGIGGTETLSVSFTNTGASATTVTSVTAPGGVFTTSGLPATGTVVQRGQSISIAVTYTPTTPGVDTATITVGSADGDGTATLTGTAAVGVKQLSITPASLDFGTVRAGGSKSLTLTVANTGNLNVTITKAAPPDLPFVVNTPLSEGQVLGPDQSVSITVTFSPSAGGNFIGLYVISSDDGTGAHNVPVSGTGKPASGTQPLPAISGGWMFNGSAAVSGSTLSLTSATANQTGSAVYSTPLPSNGLHASFTAQLSGGSGGEGMTFALLNAATTTPQSIGTGGGGLGFFGLAGVAVVLDTQQAGNDPSGNFIGLTEGGTGGTFTYLATSTDVPDLRSAPHTIDVQVVSGTVTVSVDGVQKLSTATDMPASVFAAFTGATSATTDVHAATNVIITSGSARLPQPGTGWRFNGAATLNGADTILTPAQNSLAGSVFYSRVIPTNGLRAEFTLTMNGGTGADGATFALLNPVKHTATALGAAGSGLGIGNLYGVAVAFVTFPQNGVTSNNFISVATVAGGAPTFVATTTAVPNLRSGSHAVVVGVRGTTISVWVDGNLVLTASVKALTVTAVAGFTAATGGANDVHKVSGALVQPGGIGVPVPPPPK